MKFRVELGCRVHSELAQTAASPEGSGGDGPPGGVERLGKIEYGA
jgi:hypothetical protein